MRPVELRDEGLQSLLRMVASRGVENAAQGLSEMVGRRLSVSVPIISVVPIRAVPMRAGGSERLVVGIYLACDGELGGHVMLILEMPDALRLADMILGQPEGAATELNALERSALGEAGNLVTSFFLNAVAGVTGLQGRPTPPAVIVDMAGAILDIMLVSSGQLSDEILMLEAVFQEADRQMSLQFWMVPDLDPLSSLLAQVGRAT